MRREVTTEQGHRLTEVMEMRRRLMRHVLDNWSESIAVTAKDGFGDLLADAHEEMAEELLWPIFSWSNYWPERMAAEILDLSTDDEYECSELLELFEARERKEK